MARHAFGGRLSGLSFLLLSAATAFCAVAGVFHAVRRRYQRHRRWMLRCYVLICSAVVLRLISGAAGLIGVPSPEAAYIVAAWSSWLLPLAALELIERLPARR
jgi:drug/metabolite transporter (DMT)-like permease